MAVSASIGTRIPEIRLMDRRVLLVDDHLPWRRHISSAVQASCGWCIVAESDDGPDAIEKATALQPDLILLDMELPTLSGITVARRILAAHPKTRILFISAHRSWDIVEAAMVAGARGYLLKPEVGLDLLPAMQAITDGKRWLSSTLTGRDAQTRHRHEIALYSDDNVMLDGSARFVAAALNAGKSAIMVVDEARRSRFERAMETHGVDIDQVSRELRYVPLDLAAIFAEFMVDGWPDEDRFWKAASAVVITAARASKGSGPRVAAAGEGCATLFGSNPDAAIRLECMWNELAQVYNVEVFCGYLEDVSGRAEFAPAFQKLCREHTSVVLGM